MSLIKTLFPTYEETQTAKKSVATLEKEVKSLKATIEELRDGRRRDEVYHERIVESVKYEHKNVVQGLKDEISSLKTSHEQEIKNLRSELAIEKSENQQETLLAIEQAGIDARAEVEKEIDALRKELTEALVNEAASDAAVEAQESTIGSLQGQIEQQFEMMQFIATKIPDVSLDKFNINVDIAPAEVNVVGGKPQDQAKKS